MGMWSTRVSERLCKCGNASTTHILLRVLCGSPVSLAAQYPVKVVMHTGLILMSLDICQSPLPQLKIEASAKSPLSYSQATAKRNTKTKVKPLSGRARAKAEEKSR